MTSDIPIDDAAAAASSFCNIAVGSNLPQHARRRSIAAGQASVSSFFSAFVLHPPASL
jgi:hypothetical protein